MARYGCTFPAMIADWRSKWAEGSLGETDATFPFGFVDLAPWGNPNNAPASIRWAQTAGYGKVPNPAMPNVFDAIAVDLTDHTSPYGSVHIRDKTSVGERLAAGALATVYNQASYYWQGPTASSAAVALSDVAASTVTVTFGNVGAAGLYVNKSIATGFEVCILGGMYNCSQRNASTPAATMQGVQVPAGNWSVASISSSSLDSVTLALPGSVATAFVKASGAMLVRYGWAAVPFEYKQAAVYAKASGDDQFPAGPFVIVV